MNFNKNDYRRCSKTYGDDGLVYQVKFATNTITRTTIDWMELSFLPPLKKLIEQVTGKTYNYCVIMYYPNGKIGINPHI